MVSKADITPNKTRSFAMAETIVDSLQNATVETAEAAEKHVACLI